MEKCASPGESAPVPSHLERVVLVARKLRHPDHDVRVYAYQEESGEDGLAGFDMELLDGASFAAHLAQDDPASPFRELNGLARLPWAAAFTRQIAQGLDQAVGEDAI